MTLTKAILPLNVGFCGVEDSSGACKSMKNLAPQVGLEPTTLRLTAECSTIELLRSKAGNSFAIKLHQNTLLAVKFSARSACP